MPSGRDPLIAERNAEIHAMRAGERSHGRPLSVRFIADYFDMPHQKVYKVLSDPDSTRATLVRAVPVVRLLEEHEDDGISHGSEAGYRRCRQRDEGACGDCKDAHALERQRYLARKAEREAAQRRRSSRRR